MILAEMLKITRKKALMSQEAFALCLKVSVATINRWENGRVRPNITAMNKLKMFCQERNLPFDELEKEWLGSTKEDNK